LALLLAPFNCSILYNKRSRLTEAEERFFGVTYASFEDLLRQSDAVANLVPVSEETKAMFGEREFGLMKPTAFFVNTGRAWSTDEIALARALSEGKIAGAGIDVFSFEPLPRGHPFLTTPNMLL